LRSWRGQRPPISRIHWRPLRTSSPKSPGTRPLASRVRHGTSFEKVGACVHVPCVVLCMDCLQATPIRRDRAMVRTQVRTGTKAGETSSAGRSGESSDRCVCPPLHLPRASCSVWQDYGYQCSSAEDANSDLVSVLVPVSLSLHISRPAFARCQWLTTPETAR
jgi:hypothetical protein